MPLASDTAYLAETPGSMCLWYCCMEHLSPCAISSMCHQNLVKSLDINIPQDFDHLYSGCTNRKLHCLPFSKSSNNQYSKIELVIMDLTGPMSIPTWDGFLDVLVIVEVSCCYPVERLLYTKEDTGVAIHNMIAILKRQSGLKVHCFWSNNRSEFVNEMMEIFYHCNRIIHETTIFYTPEQNGIAE